MIVQSANTAGPADATNHTKSPVRTPWSPIAVASVAIAAATQAPYWRRT